MWVVSKPDHLIKYHNTDHLTNADHFEKKCAYWLPLTPVYRAEKWKGGEYIHQWRSRWNFQIRCNAWLFIKKGSVTLNFYGFRSSNIAINVSPNWNNLKQLNSNLPVITLVPFIVFHDYSILLVLFNPVNVLEFVSFHLIRSPNN